MDYLSSWIGHARTTFTHSPDPVTLLSRSGDDSRRSLLDLCKDATPPCWLNPLLFNGHLQTFWTAMKATDIPIYYKRRVFSAEDPEFAGTFAVDFVVDPYEETDEALPPRTTHFTDGEFQALGSGDRKPMLVVLHGLSGGSYEVYLRCVLEPLVKAGWAACVVNSRGCAKSALTTGVLYNARATWDCRQIVGWCRRTWPKRKLFGMGFSLGANILTNYLGEERESCLLAAAVVCSSPWTLEVSNMALQRSFIGLQVYSKVMAENLKRLVETHAEQLSKNSRLNIERIRQVKYLHEFDREVQGPTWGYPTEGAYYRDASSTDSLIAVRVPLFAINAEDDPIAHREAIPWEEFKQNPYAVLCTTSLGGHLSWFETGGTRWFAKPAVNFLIKMAEDIEVVKPPVVDVAVSEDVSVAAKPPTFYPTRRKLPMRMDI